MAPSRLLFCNIMSPVSINKEYHGGWEPSSRQGGTLLAGCLTTRVIAFYFLNLWWRAGLASTEASTEPLGKKRKNTSCFLPRCFRCKVGHQQTWTKWLKPSQGSHANKENNPSGKDFFKQPIEKQANAHGYKLVSLLIVHEQEMLLFKGWKSIGSCTIECNIQCLKTC